MMGQVSLRHPAGDPCPPGGTAADHRTPPRQGTGGTGLSFFFAPLPLFNYDVIVLDPPTEFATYSAKGQVKSGGAQYATMTWAELGRLPVGHLAKANAILLLWATPPNLEHSFRLLTQWGARYKTELIWRKLTKSGKPRRGTGYRSAGYHESVLVAVFGDERQIHDQFNGMFDGEAREHSRKPESFYDLVRAKTLGLNRCDLFSRETRPGFDGFGFEHGKFDAPDDEQAALLDAVASLEAP